MKGKTVRAPGCVKKNWGHLREQGELSLGLSHGFINFKKIYIPLDPSSRQETPQPSCGTSRPVRLYLVFCLNQKYGLLPFTVH